MNELLANAEACLKEAEKYQAKAPLVSDKRRREIFLAISEHFFLLHDKFTELNQPSETGEVVKFRR